MISSRKGQVGQILMSFPSLVFVFVIMLLFVVVSGFLAKSNFSSEGLLDDFLRDYIVLNGKEIKVDKAIEQMCDNESIGGVLKVTLREHFIRRYGESGAFALVLKVGGGTGGWGYILYSWSGVFVDKLSEDKPRIQRFDFEDFFDSGSSQVQSKNFCGDKFALYIKDGRLK